MNDHKRAHIRRDRAGGMSMLDLARKHSVGRNELREILGLPPVAGESHLLHVTPEKVLDAIIAAEGNRSEAARRLGVSADIIRIRIRQGRKQGLKYPRNVGGMHHDKQQHERLKPGEWCEYAPSNDCTTRVTVLKCHGESVVVEFPCKEVRRVSIRTLTWVPAPDLIAQECQRIRDRWAPEEFRRRAPHAHVGEYEIPKWQTGDMSADCVW